MIFFNELQNIFITFIFGTAENYQSFLGDNTLIQAEWISFIIDFLSFLIPLLVIFTIALIPLYFIFKAFNGLIKSYRTNAITEETSWRKTRKKR